MSSEGKRGKFLFVLPKIQNRLDAKSTTELWVFPIAVKSQTHLKVEAHSNASPSRRVCVDEVDNFGSATFFSGASKLPCRHTKEATGFTSPWNSIFPSFPPALFSAAANDLDEQHVLARRENGAAAGGWVGGGAERDTAGWRGRRTAGLQDV